ncbi:MAG TPA: two-component regulator propeller domain-containing protein [Mucilaginibacter sp.]|jgi:ligand-binding sensor domain-containing protein/signal transduction histidine kinase|nr:two-component regulator propeller domain-containing protein [Mucilaginibacter sp.]
MKKYLSILLLCIIVQCAHAQTAHLSFDHLNIREGLPDNNIQDMVQDKQGYIWLATIRGIVRYDGYRVKAYKPGAEDKTNVPVYLFTSTFLDKNRDLWANSVTSGLYKYDPSTDHFIQYKNKSLHNKKVQFVIGKDSTGKIWSVIFIPGINPVFTLQQFDPATGVFKLYGRDQKGSHYLDTKNFGLYVDRQGKVWAGSDNGFYLYNPSSDSFKGYFTTSDTSKQKSMQLVNQPTSAQGKLWLSVKGKKDKSAHLMLMDLQNGKTEEFTHSAADKNSIGNDTVNIAYEDKKHRLWLGTASGLSLYDEKTNRFVNYYLTADTIVYRYKNSVNKITADKDGKLWMASGYGLLCFNPETGVFKRYIHDKADPASLSSNWNINKLLFDREGTLWIASVGVDRVNTIKSAFESFKGKGSKFPWIDVFLVLQAPDGQYWVAAQSGLYRYDKAKQTVKQISKQAIVSMCVAKSGLVYYSPADAPNNGDGLRVYDPKTGKTETYKPIEKDSTSLSNKSINFMMDDHTGTVWVGTAGSGICAFNPNTKKFKRYPFIVNDFTMTSHNKLDDQYANLIYEDKAGTLWVGSSNGGLNRYDRKKDVFISTYKPLEGVNSITSIKQDNKGRLWVGTFFNGLFLLDGHTGEPIKRFTEKDGLLSEEVWFIHTDQTDFIWVVTARGFTRINTNDYSTKTFKAAGNSWEGIFNEGNFGFWDAGKNIVGWGGDNIVLFDPNVITKDTNPPLVYLQNIVYSNPRAATDSSATIETFGKKETELPWNQNKVTFNFVGLHYADAAETKYAYQLEGYDNHWIQGGTLNSVTYTNLSPATYIFRVKAANSDGVWSKKEDSFTITILAPLWLRWWALVLYLLIFIAAIRAYIVFRSRKLLHDKRVLEETVQVRTAEVREQKEELLQQKEEIEAQAEQAVKQASVDRVRAEIASMRSTSDLEKITPLIWNELTILGVPFTRCGVFIMDEQEAEIHTYLSQPDGKALAAYAIPFNTDGFGKDVLMNWRKHQVYTDHWDEAQFKAYSKGLVEQGAVESQEKYLKALPTAGLDLHFVPFLQGMLYVGNTEPLNDDEMKALQLLAEAFSTAYARYEDFNKLEAAKKQVDMTLTDLKAAQTQLIQTEKMASLGELTAGIAHEIQNPLNFVNNFSEVNTELIDEMKESVAKGNIEDVLELADDIRENQQKISWHGKRADAIVKGMLEHARKSNGVKQTTDINALADEYLRLSYHGLRAKDKAFNALLTENLDSTLPKAEVIAQDVGRVLLNLFNNAFYAVYQKQKSSGPDFKPEVIVTTSAMNEHVLVKVKDNGNGIPDHVKDKIMQPFFTTKPTGEGTGLGLSLSYDIVVKVHGGSIDINTKEGEYTEFTITLPL